MKPQLFIVGRGRSGSSMLVEMLNMHRDVHVAPEGVFIRNLYGKYRKRKHWKSVYLQQFAEDVFTENRMKKLWSFDLEELYNYLLTGMPFENFAEVCQQLYLLQAQKAGKPEVKWLGDKNPHYSLFTKELKMLFPDAKFIHIVRHYEANCASYRKVDFDLKSPVALACRWKGFNDKILRQLQNSAQYLLVKYEELVAHPETELSRICRYLEIDFDKEMLNFYKRTKPDQPWHSNLQNPVGVAKKEEIKFSRKELQWISEVCDPLAVELGYSKRSLDTSPTKKVSYYFQLAKGHLITWLESAIYRLPFCWRNWIVNQYRKSVGSR